MLAGHSAQWLSRKKIPLANVRPAHDVTSRIASRIASLIATKPSWKAFSVSVSVSASEFLNVASMAAETSAACAGSLSCTMKTPVWSPRGDLIAFTKRVGGHFLIGVMKPDGSGERILTEGFHNEGPTWAPNGRVLMFFRESPGAGGGPRLFSIDLTGYNERLVATPSFGSDPAWSPLIN